MSTGLRQPRPQRDAIEHYAHCRVVRRVASTYLGLGPPICGHALGDFVTLGLHRGIDADGILVRRALLVYGAYQATNTIQHLTRCVDADTAVDIIIGHCKTAALGHDFTRKVVSDIWLRGSQGEGTSHTTELLAYDAAAMV